MVVAKGKKTIAKLQRCIKSPKDQLWDISNRLTIFTDLPACQLKLNHNKTRRTDQLSPIPAQRAAHCSVRTGPINRAVTKARISAAMVAREGQVKQDRLSLISA
jgi:hypothetical protein